MTDKETEKSIRRAAMNLLARREHSHLELVTKLTKKFPERHICEQIVTELAQEGLQSDKRFAENFLRWRSQKGYGRERLKMELSQKGIEDYLISEVMAESEIDWFDVLSRQFEKKYGSQPPASVEERAKYFRFFTYKGFSREELSRLF